MKASDWIIDLGPKAGINGGNIVYEGSPQTLASAKHSLTADYLLEHGMIDMVVHRKDLKQKIYKILKFIVKKN